MEMHQVRYFLATASELNFTKAAEKCNVSQPSLTRAIKQLEQELGGDLFRRERPQAQLTELGERMYPLLKQCHESAIGARSLASAIKSGEVGALKLGLSQTVAIDLVIPVLQELNRVFSRLELKISRGTAPEVLAMLKNGDIELAIAADIVDDWDRLDRWPLFTEGFQVLFSRQHDFASRKNDVGVEDLKQQRILRRSHCERAIPLASVLRTFSIDLEHSHDVTSDHDLHALLEAGFGIALVPPSFACPAALQKAPVRDIDLRRTVHLYGVAGRQRTSVGAAIHKLLRSADWSRYVSPRNN